MNLRTLLLSVALAASACSVTVPNQFPCSTVGSTTECGTNQVCGPDKLCTNLVACADTERRCNGVCTDVTSNRENCGACGTVCKPSEQCLPNASGNPTCTPFCSAGQTACAQSTGGFICENLSSDRTNCGSCGNTCPQGQVCTPSTPGGPGHCAIECVPGLTNCSGNCLDLNTDDASCGACGNACGAGQHCVGGRCSIVCTPGQTECPAGSGNCVDTTRDRDNCGGCGVACAAGQICTGSSCQVSCQAGLTLCGSTCVDTVADASNCGGCGVTCGAGEVCTNHGPGNTGLCELRCPADETACAVPAWSPSTPYLAGNEAMNGGNLYSCVTGGTSAAAGGPSGTATTAVADGTAAWVFVRAPASGAATVCANLNLDRNNCGGCDDLANTKACGDGQVCLAGHCSVSCAPGLTNCNGTCIDTRNDPANCGACGVSCSAAASAGPVCGNGTCGVSCPAGETNCSGKCVDTASDPNNCGTGAAACGVRCPAGQLCSGGGCTLTCAAGSIPCGGRCIDPLSDNNNCGGCGQPCGPGQVCSAGTCSATCSAPLTTCSPGTAGAYCANLSYDPANCGVCGTACPPQPNASVYCASGTCSAACTGTFAHCTTVATDVCETDLSSTAAHCGTCTNSCPAADNASPACVSSSCSTTCHAGALDCDLDPGTGCEADPAHDAANCGACGATCPAATPYCTSGCVAFAGASGVQENLSIPAVQALAEWGAPCYTETYAHAGTTLATIQAACPAGTQVLVACAAPGASTLLVGAAGPRVTVFGGGTSGGVSFYVPGTGTPAFGFAPAGAVTSFTGYDVGGTAADGFAASFGSQRLSWPVQSGALTAGGRCGDRVGSSATSNYQRLVFTR